MLFVDSGRDVIENQLAEKLNTGAVQMQPCNYTPDLLTLYERQGKERVLEGREEKRIWRFRWWKCNGSAAGKLEMWADTIVC